MAGSSNDAQDPKKGSFFGFNLIDVLLIISIVVVLGAAYYWWDGVAYRDFEFNKGFNERADQYFNRIGPEDPFLRITTRSMQACADYARLAAQTELQKSKESTDAKLYQAGRQSFDACMNLHLVDLQSTLRDDRLVVLKAGLECDKGCPMRVIEGFHPWSLASFTKLTRSRGL